jgi:hypothetical protein
MNRIPPNMVDIIAMATYPIPRELTRESLIDIFCLIAKEVFWGEMRMISTICSIRSVRFNVGVTF